MLRLNGIVGRADAPALAARLHALEHAGKVEYLALSRADTQRKRLRIATDRGTDCAIALARGERLFDGAVLLLEAERAVVVRLAETPWLLLEPRNEAAALELGYFAGNLHWRVRFEGARIAIALDGEPRFYLERLAPFLADGRARKVER